MIEIWKPIKGYEGLYEVSNLGRVKSLSRLDCRGQSRPERLLKPYVKSGTPGNYLLVKLSKFGKTHGFSIHRLVACAFVDGDHNLEVNHIDKDRQNNVVTNLEWVTAAENYAHSFLHGRKHPRSRPVVLIKGSERMTFDQCKDADAFLGASRGSVSNSIADGFCVRGWRARFL